MLYEIVPERNREQFEAEGDTDFAYEIENVARFRCNFFKDRMGVGAVFRLIPSDVLTVKQLDLPKAMLDLCLLSKGLVVVTGPTGSGKSTTLAAWSITSTKLATTTLSPSKTRLSSFTRTSMSG